jgi:SOS-response transcriptional repressor LexA
VTVQVKHDLRQVFAWIVAYKSEHDGNSPTLREMMIGCGIPTTSVMSYSVKKMEKLGWIRIERGISRNIYVIGGEWRIAERGAAK